MADKPVYLVHVKCYAEDVDGKPGNTIINGTPKDPRIVRWPAHIEPSRTFTPMNQAAAEALDRLYESDKKRLNAEIKAKIKPKNASLRWKPKPIPEPEEQGASDAYKLEHLQAQVAALEERISGTQKPGTVRDAAKDTDRLDADRAESKAAAKAKLDEAEAGLQPNAANDTPA